MVWFWRILEKILVYIVFMFVSVIISFSAVTGKFPPRKEDMMKAYHLGLQLYQKHQELQAAQKGLVAQQANGEQVLSGSLEQMTRLQELNLERMKVAVELSKIFAIFPSGTPNPELDARIREVASHLETAEKGLIDIQSKMQTLPKESK